jgi:hypothetical protein
MQWTPAYAGVIISGMKNYAEVYNKATKKILARAKEIDLHIKYTAPYSLYNIVSAMRELFKDCEFRDAFAKNDDENWSRGMCALSSIAINTLAGKEYQLMAISPKDWDLGPLIFVKTLYDDKPFHTTDGQVFAGHRIPYELAFPLDIEKIRTPNKTEFINAVAQKIEEMNND